MLQAAVTWQEPTDAYRQAYAQAISSAAQLGTVLRERVSIPHTVVATEEYLQSKHRLMIVGQETYGMFDKRIAGADPKQTFEKEAAETKAFAHGQKESSPFWRGFREACSHFQLSPFGAVWSNLVKVQALNEHSTSFLSLAPDERLKVLEWQKPLFQVELTVFEPKLLLAFTGPSYDWIWDRMIDDLEWVDIEGHAPRALKQAYSPSMGIHLVRTYHPGYLQRIKRLRPLISSACDVLIRADSHSM